MQYDESFDERCAEAWESSRNHTLDPADESRMLTLLLGQMRVEDRKAVRFGRRSVIFIAAASAAFVFAIASSVWGWTRFHELNHHVEEMSIRADKGQKTRITLPDGTVVNLNSDSELIYQSTFNRLNRDITLSGEAYFEVAKNADLPFVVKAGDFSVKALGTKFNVSAYPDDCTVTTTLTEGKVLAWSDSGNCILSPGEELSWDRNSGRFVKGRVASQAHMVPWMENQLYLDNESFGQLAKSISRMYNVEIIYNEDDVGSLRFTGLVRNSSLVSVLDMICASSNLKYHMENNIIYFNNK